MTSYAASFDYAGWVRRFQQFYTELPQRLPEETTPQVVVDPPLTESEFEQLAARIPGSVPESVRRFLREGSASCRIRFRDTANDAWVGNGFLSAPDLPEWLAECRHMAEETWVHEYPQDRELWLHSLPIASMLNGDYLAVYAPNGEADPPVIYLSHNDESFQLAETFTGFLATWERLCYVGPEIWMLEPFLDPETGLLSSESENAVRLREYFGQQEDATD